MTDPTKKPDAEGTPGEQIEEDLVSEDDLDEALEKADGFTGAGTPAGSDEEE